MINQKEITSEWISKVSKANKNADKVLIEKVIRALLLLEGLVKQKIEFIFKGGTALMLHFNSTKRLSIDIDIILPKGEKSLNSIFDNVVKEQGFIKKEEQIRESSSKIKKTHFKFFYSPLYKTNKIEDNVLLDILFEEVNYQNIIQLPITSAFVPIIDKPLLVNLPSLEDILGDKLTAFAPNTTGIPYFKNENSMSMEIIKQLYDIGNLFDRVENLSIIKKTFSKFAETELQYRKTKNCNVHDVIEDIYQTALTIASRGMDGKGDFEQLQLGVQRIRAYIFSESFNIEKAIVLASKAAYLIMLIKTDSEIIEKYSNPLQMKDWLIDKPMNTKLNKLKKSNPEAFYYWYKIYKLRMEEN
jgi:predicted nucleotidyltransferase component of viral defense system